MRKIKTLILLTTLAGLSGLGFAQAAAGTAETAPGLAAKIDALFAPWDKKDSPGLVLAVIRDGKILYQRGYGMADLERGIANTPESVMDIGSVSKQFTAACVLMLARRGKLKLDDPVRQYLPEIPDYGTSLTIRHLLHHTSGLRDYLTLMALAGMPVTNDYPEEQVLDLIARQKELNFAPGNEFLYSNSGYFLLALIVKRVSGQSLRRFAEENIFKPLGMVHTHIHDDFTEIVPHRSIGYSPRDKGGWQIDMSIFDVVGDGAVLTTVGDLFLWDQNFYHNVLAGGGNEFIEQLQTPGVLNSGEKLDYAFGLGVDTYRGLKRVSHGGGWAGYLAMFLRFPGQKFSVICLANRGNFNPAAMADKVTDLCLEKELLAADADKEEKRKSEPAAGKARSIVLSAAELGQLTGTYHNPETGALWRIYPKEGKLRVAAGSGFAFDLAPVERLRFLGVETPFPITVSFVKAKPKAATGIKVQFADRKIQDFEALQPYAPTEAELSAYAGDYYSPELDATQFFRVRDKQLTAALRYEPEPAKLQPVLRDEFSMSGATIVFRRSEKGEIIGYAVKAGRVKNIAFNRK